MNETRNILIGFEFGRDGSQICYYDRLKDEALSLPLRVGTDEIVFLNCISTGDKESWHFGPEAEYFARQKGEQYIGDLYQLCQKNEPIRIIDQEYTPGQLLAIFLQESLKLLGVKDPLRRISAIMMTTPRITRVLVDNVREAYEILGLSSERCSLQEYEESFFYETFSQRQDGRGRKVGLFVFEDGGVSFTGLAIDQRTRPAMVALRKGRRAVLNEDPMKRDLEFYNLINESLGNDVYSALYLVGDGFSRDWAKKSVPLLCKSQRRVFVGDNLYAKGACLAARERVEEKRLKSYLYVGSDMVMENIGMEMIINGTGAYYPLVAGGTNWYDVNARCELLLDQEDHLKFLVSDMATREKRHVVMALDGLPKRPPKASRLRVSIEYASAKQMTIRVEDLGFGDLYPSSGKVWEEVRVEKGGLS